MSTNETKEACLPGHKHKNETKLEKDKRVLEEEFIRGMFHSNLSNSVMVIRGNVYFIEDWV